MTNDKLRRQITYEAARLLVAGRETDLYQAKMRAGKKICRGWVKPDLLPLDQEIRDEIQSLSRLHEGQAGSSASMEPPDRFQLYRSLLAPLATVRQKAETHPEGDALYHSLQVFELARDALPYDEEFQLAALLHDVGKAIDPRNHIPAALGALNGHITERTAWLIEHHSEAGALRDGTLGLRAKTAGSVRGFRRPDAVVRLRPPRPRSRARVADLDEALAHVRDLAAQDGAG